MVTVKEKETSLNAVALLYNFNVADFHLTLTVVS